MSFDVKKASLFGKYLCNAYVDFIEFYEVKASLLSFDTVMAHDISRRYFKDVDRLHNYHNIRRVDASKIAGFTTWWITKLRPISVLNQRTYESAPKFYVFVNELFALYIATGRLVCKPSIESIRLTEEFLTMFLYTLKYRKTSGDTLSLMYYLTEKATM